jgi:hypothetical protein
MVAKKDSLTDPIGLELILSLVHLGIASVAALHEFGLLPRIAPQSAREFRQLREAVLEAQNQLDDLILTFERHISSAETSNSWGNAMTLSSTLLYLRDRDYRRFTRVRDTLNGLSQEVAQVIRQLRLIQCKRQRKPSVRVISLVMK